MHNPSLKLIPSRYTKALDTLGRGNRVRVSKDLPFLVVRLGPRFVPRSHRGIPIGGRTRPRKWCSPSAPSRPSRGGVLHASWGTVRILTSDVKAQPLAHLAIQGMGHATACRDFGVGAFVCPYFDPAALDLRRNRKIRFVYSIAVFADGDLSRLRQSGGQRHALPYPNWGMTTESQLGHMTTDSSGPIITWEEARCAAHV
jgi:hypothetical protein